MAVKAADMRNQKMGSGASGWLQCVAQSSFNPSSKQQCKAVSIGKQQKSGIARSRQPSTCGHSLRVPDAAQSCTQRQSAALASHASSTWRPRPEDPACKLLTQAGQSCMQVVLRRSPSMPPATGDPGIGPTATAGAVCSQEWPACRVRCTAAAARRASASHMAVQEGE